MFYGKMRSMSVSWCLFKAFNIVYGPYVSLLTLQCNRFYFLRTVSPTIEKRGSEVSIEEGVEATISCRVTKSNPLPTFSWQYAVITSLKEDRWNTVPGRLILTKSSTPSNESIVKVEKDQGDAEYRCQARNSLGSDFYIFRLARLGKNIPQKVFTFIV